MQQLYTESATEVVDYIIFKKLYQYFTSTTFILCITDECSRPAVKDGMVKIFGKDIHAFAQYKCNPSYLLKGSSFRQCLLHGEWSGNQPVCHRKFTNLLLVLKL